MITEDATAIWLTKNANKRYRVILAEPGAILDVSSPPGEDLDGDPTVSAVSNELCARVASKRLPLWRILSESSTLWVEDFYIRCNKEMVLKTKRNLAAP